jgi:hypothetical protein
LELSELNVIIIPGLQIDLPIAIEVVALINKDVVIPLVAIVKESIKYDNQTLNKGMYGIDNAWSSFNYTYIDIDEKYASLFEQSQKIHTFQVSANDSTNNILQALASIPFNSFKAGDIILAVTPLEELIAS